MKALLTFCGDVLYLVLAAASTVIASMAWHGHRSPSDLEPRMIPSELTPLMRAVTEGDEAAVRALLQDDTLDLHARTSIGVTALSIARTNEQDEIVRLLLDARAQRR